MLPWDPAARAMAGGLARARRVLVDPAAYRWQHPDWRGRPVGGDRHLAIFYVGYFSPRSGTFRAATERLLGSWQRSGITAVELMPVAQFQGGTRLGL